MDVTMKINVVSAGIALLLGAALPAYSAPDKLTVVVTDEPKSLDPCDTDLSGNSRVVHNNITEALVNLNPKDGSVVASLATDWRQVDALTWEFKLREGVTFHDGKTFDADAVVAALKRAQDPPLACEVGLATLKGVKFTAVAVNPTTVLIKTDVVEPILPNKMSALDIGSPATPSDGKTRAPAGTGPYQLTAWTPGQSVTLSAYGGYWGEKPPIKHATIIWRAESAVRAAMVDTGEAQIAYEIAPQSL
ncbi:dipeptide/oligopeptide ABC transporter substrate-binding domain-containing protein (plasmid) [Rhizobium sp. N541]|nr:MULTISPECIES: ABC transporter substrate-binding protein [unclassified Rhizobium]ANM14193.1 dipeptide/oligopeptide ABC transporter substrate-binding domain-containing protein [Rhizobium sp. N324]ANM20577.1 dipeptide/oligopeptide ABC transporter substrate-binding domain-containing protein [Rhizobium sp. N541]ANM26961.1 dipeptide/oligopeptide ABC transporter substrate-binding domain-containing protein [Rhizobium sp. N941]OYD00366.1 dipeptide/oligopeptide ABC transporter substrate-binding domain